jgi:DNA invertase Pin-like site-specific DNA recombinase
MSQDTICHICNSGEDEAHMLLCDQCDRGFHTGCLNLRSVPSGSWYCPGCIRASATTTTTTATTTTTKVKINEPKEVYVYIRVSSKGQNNPEYGRVGMDTQNVTILQFCKDNNLYVKSCVTEVGSAYHTHTPKLDKLIEKNKGIPIMVYSFSRFSRNVADCESKISALHEKGGYIWSVTDKMTSKDSGFMSLVRAAENESRLLGKRISDAAIRIKAQGGYSGKKPFGYTIVRVDGVRKLKKNSLEQKIMKKLQDAAKIHPRTKVLAIAMKKYSRFQWSARIINDIITDRIRFSYQITEGVQSDMMEAIDEIQVESNVNTDVNTDNVYLVNKIMKIRIHQGIYQFMLKWEGGGQVTWENVVSVNEDIPEMVQEFLEKSTSVYVQGVKELLM